MADFPAWSWSQSKAAKSPEYKAAVNQWLKLKTQYKGLNKGFLGLKYGAEAKRLADAAKIVEGQAKRHWEMYLIAEKEQKLASGEKSGFMSNITTMFKKKEPEVAPVYEPITAMTSIQVPAETPDNTWLYAGLGIVGLAAVGGFAYYYYQVR